MSHQIIQPHQALQPFIKEFWFLDSAKGGGSIPLSFSPSPEQCLYFYPKNLPKPILPDGSILNAPNNIITGQSVSSGKMIVPDNYCMFKIQFRAGGFFRLFGIPMTQFADGFEESISVLGNPMKALQEQVQNAQDFNEMVRFSEGYLLKRLAQKSLDKLPIDWVLNQQNLHHYSIDKLASDACLSTRQFERKCLERLGVSPKIYQRIIRFNQAMKLKKQYQNQSWIKITYDTGYFDQMHLLRDFKQFTGATPSIFDFDKAVIY